MNVTKKYNDNELMDQEIVAGLIKRYEGLVYKFVNSATTNTVCSYEDLVQEGKMAIVHAYRTYDPTKGASLSTWIYHMVKDSILEYQKSHLRFLSGGAYLNNAIRKAGGRGAAIEDIMSFGVSKKTALASVYLNERPSSYGECFNMADRKAAAQLREIESCQFDYRKYLTEKEVFAIEHYFGLRYADKWTMEEIGEHLGKSRKSVSCLINQAIVKLRHIDGVEDLRVR